eukprot:scaffold84_cov388-Prasinococcus_capsulatus_cf.AAC.11
MLRLWGPAAVLEGGRLAENSQLKLSAPPPGRRYGTPTAEAGTWGPAECRAQPQWPRGARTGRSNVSSGGGSYEEASEQGRRVVATAHPVG